MADRIRVLRVLEYEGTRDWVEGTLKKRGVKGERVCVGDGIIREAIVGEFPAIFTQKEGANED